MTWLSSNQSDKVSDDEKLVIKNETENVKQPSPPFGTSVSIGSRKSTALSSSAC